MIMDLPRILAAMARDIQELRRQGRGRLREGVVTEVDGPLVRVDVGREGAPLITGWVPVQTASAGSVSQEFGVDVGQRVRVTSESGDLTDATVSASSFADDVPALGAAPGEQRITAGNASVSVRDGEIRLSVGGSSLTITSGGFAFEGGSVTHGGTNIGRTHTHTHGDPAGTTAPPS